VIGALCVVLAPVRFVHDCMPHSFVLVDYVELLVADGVLPDHSTNFGGLGQQGASGLGDERINAYWLFWGY
jgi:hypothetical protein